MVVSRFREAIRQGCVDPYAASCPAGKGSAPPAPDYSGAATAQGAANLETAIGQNLMNRVNQYTPLGSLEYTQTGMSQIPGTNKEVPTYRSDVNLSPTGQQIYDTQLNQSLGMANLANKSLGQTEASLSKPVNTGGIEGLQDRAYGAMTSRLDPQWKQNETSYETKLINQGLRPGGEAYDNAMRVFNQGKNDAYRQAQVDALRFGPTLLQEETALRQMPLNELNALRTGSQVSMPQFGNTGGASVAPPNVAGATAQAGQYATDVYNAEQARQANMMSGLFGLGSAGMMAYALSDRRLKSNVVMVWTHPLGIGVYEYDIFGRRERGVMADEVMSVKPEAVIRRPDGYLMVNYGML